MKRWALAIHGGAGRIQRPLLRPEQERAYRTALSEALHVGADVLSSDGTAVQAVEVAVRIMEDNPLFNAGRGAVFTEAGGIELDAAIMEGELLSAGAVAGVTRTRHPISLARRLMEESRHVMLCAAGADAFSERGGLEQVDPGWFQTEARWRSLTDRLAHDRMPAPRRPPAIEHFDPDSESLIHDDDKFGTVGAVALDRFGNVAAGTSSGGTTGKRSGRIGDSPVIGAGTYATNASCAVSATGSGEHLIRIAAAREVCALVEHKQLPLQAAVDEVIQVRLAAIGGAGGVVAVARDAQIAWSFSTAGMYRACIASDRPLRIGLYQVED